MLDVPPELSAAPLTSVARRRAALVGVPGSVLLAAVVAAGYALGSQVSFWWFGADGVSASFFPASGVLLAAFVLVPVRSWPVVAVAGGATELLLDLAHGIGVAASLGYVAANVAQALVGAALIRTWVGVPDIARLRGLGAFVTGGVVLAPVLGGGLGAATASLLDGNDEPARFALEWWVGDGLGVLVVGAAILAFRSSTGAAVSRHSAEALLLALAATGGAAAFFWLRWPPAAFVVVGILLVLGFRHGTRTVALTSLVTAFVSAQAASEGHAYWDAMSVSPATGVVYVQAVLAAVVMVSLLLAAQIRERERAVGARAVAEAARTEADRSVARSERLRALAEALSEASTAQEVGEAFLSQALAQVGASGGALKLLVDDGRQVEIAALLGSRPERWQRVVPCEPTYFIPAAVIAEEPVWASTRGELVRRFPGSAASLGPETASVVAIPLRAFGKVIGAFGLEFDREQETAQLDLDLLETMASVCGPALERGRSFDAEAAAHRALRASESRFRGTFENAPVGIAEADLHGRYLRVNPRMCAITGYSEDELLGLTYQEITHPDDLEADVGLSLEVIAGTRETYALEKRYIRRDRSIVWVALEVSASRDESGAITHLIAVVEDITSRKTAEAALRQSEGRFRALFSSIDEGYCLAEMILDEAGEPVDYVFLEVNPLFESMSGLSDAVGRTALELVPDLERSWIETYARVALAGEQMRFENGSEAMGRWFDVFATPVEPRGRFALVFKDITARRDAERRLRDSEAAERRSRRRAEILTEVMAELEAVESFEGRAKRLVELLVPHVADYATVEVPGQVDPIVALAHRDPARVDALRRLRDGAFEGAGANGGEARGKATVASLAELAPHTHLVLPLAAGDLRGTLVVGVADPSRPAFGQEDVAFLRDVASHAGTLLASARLREAEHLVAISLQRALLPDDVLRHAAVSVGAHYEAGADVLEVGGDWYDSFELPDGRIGLVVGDVVGHGLEAAATMGRFRTALAALARDTADPARLLERMEAFANGPDGCDFATCCYAILDPATGELRYASAGHPAILLVRGDGDASWLDDAQSLPLCGIQGVPRGTGTVVLEPDTLLVLYSDGLVERRREPIEVGLRRLRHAAIELRNEPVQRICSELVRRMREHAGGEDDAVAVAVRFTPTTARSFRHVMPARSESLAGLRARLRAWLDLAGVDAERQGDALITVGEAAANAVEHAYRDEEPGTVEVEARVDEPTGAIDIVVRDFGQWSTAPTRDLRGRGTGIMELLSETIDRRTDATGTTVRLRLADPAAVPAPLTSH